MYDAPYTSQKGIVARHCRHLAPQQLKCLLIARGEG
ncbi:hypothetical protein AZZ62_002614, partial [Klebsiella variicola]